MMRASFIFTLFLVGIFPQASFSQFGVKSVTTLKEEARARLLQRKQGFDRYQQLLEEREKRRLAQAFKMKEIRLKYAQQLEQQRKSFVRKTEAFPRQDYQAFLRRREQRRKDLEKDRQNYVAVQEELENIFENKKYRIDGNKEFDL